MHTSKGETVKVSQLLALDRKNDLAVLATGRKTAEFLVVPAEPAKLGEACAVIFPLEAGKFGVSDGRLLARQVGIDRTETRQVDLWSVGISLSSPARTASPVIVRDGRIAGLLSHYRPSYAATSQRLALAIPETAIASVLARAREARQPLAFPSGDESERDTDAHKDPDFVGGVELQKRGIGRLQLGVPFCTWEAPEKPLGHEKRGDLLLETGDVAGARAIFEEARRIAPGRLDLRELLGLVMTKEGDVAGAIEFFQAFTVEVPNYWRICGTGWETVYYSPSARTMLPQHSGNGLNWSQIR